MNSKKRAGAGRRIASVVLSALLVFGLLPMLPAPAQAAWDGIMADTDWYTYDVSPYAITTEADLAGLANLVNAGNDFAGDIITLMADLDLGGQDWTPIGNANTSTFRGSFDGDGRTVSGLRIGDSVTPAAHAFTGLFGVVDTGGTVKNLGVHGSGIYGKVVVTGGLAGRNNGTIVNCYATVGSVNKGPATGGLVGNNTGAITNCYATGDVFSEGQYTAGLVGNNTGAITNCYATGNVSSSHSNNRIGGLVGYSGGAITNCYGAGSVSSSGTGFFGGFVGFNNSSGVITDGYFNADGNTAGAGNNIGTGAPTPKTLAEMRNGAFLVLLRDYVTASGNPDLSDWAQLAAQNSGFPYLVPVGSFYILMVTAPIFADITEGDTPQAAQAITLTNTGSVNVTVSDVTVGSTDFLIGGSGSNVPAGTDIASWTVQPADGLSAGTYTETVTVTYNSGEERTATTQVTLHVAKKPVITPKTYTVTFLSEGKTWSIRNVAAGGRTPKPEDPTRDGYTFGGWYRDAACTVPYDFSTPVTGRLTLYAGWRETGKTVFPYIAGYPDGTFRPGGGITRAEAAQMLYSLTNGTAIIPDGSAGYSGGFTDVSGDDWYYDAVTYLAGTGVLAGYPDGSFRPGGKITRAEFTVMAARCMDLEPLPEAGFPDIPQGHWAAGHIAAAKHAGLVSGYPDGSFHPAAGMARAEAVTLLNRMPGRGADEHVLAGLAMPFSDVPENHWAYHQILAAAVEHVTYG